MGDLVVVVVVLQDLLVGLHVVNERVVETGKFLEEELFQALEAELLVAAVGAVAGAAPIEGVADAARALVRFVDHELAEAVAAEFVAARRGRAFNFAVSDHKPLNWGIRAIVVASNTNALNSAMRSGRL